jgi:ribose-phosphate pyrophosphokinase
MRLFALNGTEELGAAIAKAAGLKLDPHEERDFEDGEHKSRPLVSVRGEDVYVIHSLHGTKEQSANDKLVRLLFFLATCRENGAARVTAIVPYLAYSRKDRQTKSRDPVTTRYVAQLFESVGIDMMVTLDVHNFVAYQNAFRCPTTHLDTRRLFSQDIKKRAEGLPVVIFSPDGGGVKRAQLLREAYEEMTGQDAGFGFMEKRRSAGVVSGDMFAGDVKGAAVFIVDDMISTGGTMRRAAQACRENGAEKVFGYAAHGLFKKGAEEVIADPAFDAVIVTDSTIPFKLAPETIEKHIEIVSCAPLFADAIMRLHGDGSIHRLLEAGN